MSHLADKDMRLAVEIPKIALAISGVGLWVYHTVLFNDLALNGSKKGDALHVVQLNDHGSYSYITLAQSSELTHVAYAAGLLFSLAVLIDLIQRKRAK
jgi:hypothetical protein